MFRVYNVSDAYCLCGMRACLEVCAQLKYKGIYHTYTDDAYAEFIISQQTLVCNWIYYLVTFARLMKVLDIILQGKN